MTENAGRVFFQHIAHDGTRQEWKRYCCHIADNEGKVPKRGVVTGEKSTTSQGWTRYSLRTQM
nr:hypothetical protein P5621_21190 [Bacillus subtilis]